MKDNILTVSIGIPAYNEEANIKQLIEEVRSQRTPYFMIKEIIVVSDGSTDKTGEIVKSIEDPRIRLIERNTRGGQAQCQNEILGLFESDALILLEADTHIEDRNYLALLTYPLWRCTADFVFGLSTPQFGGSLVERSLTLAAHMKQRACETDARSELFLCHSGKALSRSFAKRMRFMSDVPEDALTFLRAKELGFRTMFERDAITYYRSPGTVLDYFRKYARFAASHKRLHKYVANDVIEQYKYFPKQEYVEMLVKTAWETFVPVGVYALLHVGARAYSLFFGSANPLWEVSLSTKNLGRAYE